MDFRRKANPGAHVRSTATGCPPIDLGLVAGCSKLQSPFRQKGPTRMRSRVCSTIRQALCHPKPAGNCPERRGSQNFCHLNSIEESTGRNKCVILPAARGRDARWRLPADAAFHLKMRWKTTSRLKTGFEFAMRNRVHRFLVTEYATMELASIGR